MGHRSARLVYSSLSFIHLSLMIFLGTFSFSYIAVSLIYLNALSFAVNWALAILSSPN